MSTPDSAGDDGLFPASAVESAVPPGIDRRSFLMRNAVIGAAAAMTGTTWTPEARAQQAAKEAAQPKLGATMSPDLDVVKKSKGPVMTVLEEFYKAGPGPSSSHTIGPMRITHDFYQRCTKLPADKLAQATGLKVHLFGSLSATGKGHGTERASLAGLLGKEPATVDPLFLDEMKEKPDQTYPVKLGDKTCWASPRAPRCCPIPSSTKPTRRSWAGRPPELSTSLTSPSAHCSGRCSARGWSRRPATTKHRAWHTIRQVSNRSFTASFSQWS
jgi:hypothetical protein